MSAIYLLLIVGSVFLAVATLPPLINKAIGPYKDLLSGTTTSAGSANQDLIEEARKFLEEYGQ